MKDAAQTLLRWETDLDGILTEVREEKIDQAIVLIKRLRQEIMQKQRGEPRQNYGAN